MINLEEIMVKNNCELQSKLKTELSGLPQQICTKMLQDFRVDGIVPVTNSTIEVQFTSMFNSFNGLFDDFKKTIESQVKLCTQSNNVPETVHPNISSNYYYHGAIHFLPQG